MRVSGCSTSAPAAASTSSCRPAGSARPGSPTAWNKTEAGAENVEFLKGTIEDVPLPDGSVDVVISNCVINLSTDKPAVLAEMFRVLTPGGRIGVSDVVAEDRLTPEQRAERGSYVGCIAGALSKTEYLDGLAKGGFADASVEFTHEAADGMHAAIVRATKPAN